MIPFRRFLPGARAAVGFVLLFAAGASLRAEILLAAEDAERLGAVTLATSAPGFSGAGYLTGFTNARADAARFTFEAEGGLYALEIGFATPSGQKGYGLWLNDVANHGMFPNTSGAFDVHAGGNLLLLDGENTIEVGAEWGWYHLDFLRLIPATAEPPPQPPRSLSNPEASPAARALHGYLIDLYGTKILSSQQDLREMRWVHQNVGKMPAIGSFDVMDYSPSRRAPAAAGGNPAAITGTNPANGLENSENWIDWQQEWNGIVALMWHWNAPNHLYPDTTTPRIWWRGFYTEATTFDLAATLADKAGEDFQLLLRDLDAIAVELKKFQDKGIPLLWRPLHEAAGGWFWWGAAGSDAFIELWQLMYDRYTGLHGLDYLIWVYTHEMGHPEWYPGDAYVDIVGIDIYTEVGASMSGQWQEMIELFGARKLVTLSESGTLPEPDQVRAFGTWWSWFSIWNGHFIRDQDLPYLTAIYDDPDILNVHDLRAWQTLWHASPEYNGWRLSKSLGWLYDPAHPHYYSLTFGAWLYVHPTGARLDQFYFYDYGTGDWYLAIESFNGWVYQITGDAFGWRVLE